MSTATAATLRDQLRGSRHQPEPVALVEAVQWSLGCSSAAGKDGQRIRGREKPWTIEGGETGEIKRVSKEGGGGWRGID